MSITRSRMESALEAPTEYFSPNSGMAIHHPVYGWQARLQTPNLRLLIVLCGKATDMNEFRLGLLGLPWVYVKIFLMNADRVSTSPLPCNRATENQHFPSLCRFLICAGEHAEHAEHAVMLCHSWTSKATLSDTMFRSLILRCWNKRQWIYHNM